MPERSVVLLLALIFGSYAAAPAKAEEATVQSQVLGYWATQDSILQVSRAGDSLSMRVVAMQNPTYTEGEPHGPPGAVRVDVNNPDEALRDRQIMGMELLSDYEFSKNRWRGKIYDPQSGNTYSSTMWVEDGELQMRGYIGVAFLGRTQTFAPVAGCTAQVRQLLVETSFSAFSCD
jgi:uncharacterized protein (DUF2147 family)